MPPTPVANTASDRRAGTAAHDASGRPKPGSFGPPSGNTELVNTNDPIHVPGRAADRFAAQRLRPRRVP
jgi:hypothetical protein